MTPTWFEQPSQTFDLELNKLSYGVFLDSNMQICWFRSVLSVLNVKLLHFYWQFFSPCLSLKMLFHGVIACFFVFIKLQCWCYLKASLKYFIIKYIRLFVLRFFLPLSVGNSIAMTIFTFQEIWFFKLVIRAKTISPSFVMFPLIGSEITRLFV